MPSESCPMNSTGNFSGIWEKLMKKIIPLAVAFCLLGGFAVSAATVDTQHGPDQGPGQMQNNGDNRPQGRDDHGNKPGIYVGGDSFGIYLDSRARKDDQRRKEDLRHQPPAQNFGGWYADPNRYHSFDRSSWNKRDCFPVSRRAFDKHGRQVTNAAVMCYKKNGQTYIVPDSRRTFN